MLVGDLLGDPTGSVVGQAVSMLEREVGVRHRARIELMAPIARARR